MEYNMTDREKMFHRENLKDQIRLDYNMMKETYNREFLEYLEGHVKGLLSAYNAIGVITCKIRFKYDDFIVAVYESRKEVCE